MVGVSFSTQVLALNWASRCREKWGKEESGKRIPQSSSRWKALLSECMDTRIWGACLPQLSKARRVQNTKGTTEMDMKTRIGTGTCNKSCKLRGLWGPGRQCLKWKRRSMWVRRKWPRVWQTQRHSRWLSFCWLDLQSPDLLIFVVFFFFVVVVVITTKLEIWHCMWHLPVFRKPFTFFFFLIGQTKYVCGPVCISLCGQPWLGVNCLSEKHTYKRSIQWALQ